MFKKKPKLSRNRLVVVLMVVLIILGLAYWFLLANKASKNSELKQRQAEIEEQLPGYIKERNDEIQDRESHIKDSELSAEDQSLEYYMIANNYERIKDYDNAIKYALLASQADMKTDPTMYTYIADLYKAKNDYSKAREYYNKSRKHIEDNVSGQSQKAFLSVIDERIKELEE